MKLKGIPGIAASFLKPRPLALSQEEHLTYILSMPLCGCLHSNVSKDRRQIQTGNSPCKKTESHPIGPSKTFLKLNIFGGVDDIVDDDDGSADENVNGSLVTLPWTSYVPPN